MDPSKKKAVRERDTHRPYLAMSLHCCNECNGMEVNGMDCWREDVPILHEKTCSFYPSLANIEHVERLKKYDAFHGSKWDEPQKRP
jgi:hypothetical protein